MVLVAIVLTMSVASATDWQQFQKDEVSVGWTTDRAPIYDSPTEAWNYTLDGWIDTTPIVGDGQVFALSGKGRLYAFNPKTGDVNWSHQCSPSSGGFEVSVPAYNNGTVYVATSAGSAGFGYCRVTTLHASSGNERENITLKTTYGYQLNTPVTYADGKIYVGDWNGSADTTNGSGTYWCLNASNVSDIIWSYRPDRTCTGYYWAGAAIVGDYIIFGDDTANVTCLNITASCLSGTGVVVDYVNVSEAPFNINNPVEEIRSSVVWNESTGRIYFTGKKPSPVSGHAYAVGFNPNTGHFNTTDYWVTDIGYSTSTPVVYNGGVYVCIGGMYGGSGVRCLNEVDGSIRYSIDKGASQASPAVSVVDGHVYIYFTTNVNNGSAYCIEDNGTALVERWEWNPPEPDNQFILQGMAIADGMVYFGTDYGRVYALGNGLEQFDIPIYNGMNLIAIPLIQEDTTLAAVFGDDPVNWDKVRRYNNSLGCYKTAQYYNGVWYDAELVEPIEPEVGYEYERKGADYTLTVVGTRCTGTISTPIYNGKNLIGYVNFTETDLSTFNSPVNWDKVRRYNNSLGCYKAAQYYNGVWYDANLVEPIEAGVGYEYERKGAQYDWIYEA
jgi:outer membrane protein assembly factor BamB